MTRRCLTIAGLVAATFVVASSASAQTRMFSTQFGASDTTNVAIGVVNKAVWIIEHRPSDGACRFQQASPEPKLTSFVRFAAGNGPNRVRIVQGPSTWNANLCGFTLTPIQSNSKGFITQVFGNDGNDVILVAEGSAAYGDAGHDVIYGDGMWLGIAGGSGNDWLLQGGDWNQEGDMYGESGDDRLCDLADGSHFFGGDGHDLGWNGFGAAQDMEGTMSSRQDCDNVGLWIILTQTF